MSDKLKELRQRRGQLVSDGRAILDKAEAEKRNVTPEEDAKYNEIFKDVDGVTASIAREERQLENERQVAEQALRNKDAKEPPKTEDGAQARGSASATAEYRAAFSQFMVGGPNSLSDAQRRELRALAADADVAGGYTIAPEMFVDQLIKAVDNFVFIRQRATKFRLTSAQSMGVPTLAADPADSDWTAEIATGNEDSSMSFGKREMTPRPLAKRIKVSNKLLRMTSPEALVMARLAYKFGITQEKVFMTGTGANQPLGLFTASNDGISTGRDVSTGNSTTAPTFDGLIAAKYALKGNYWAKAEWLFHRDVLGVIAKLKDGEGDYIWRESVRAGEPDRLLNVPFMMSEYAPNTMTTGLYVGMLGDFSNYWICDAIDMQVQRLVELYAETNQTGFIGRLETDGMPVLEEAFVRVKLA